MSSRWAVLTMDDFYEEARELFEFSPTFKLIIVGNHQPTLRNVDEAMRRRLRIVRFAYKPAEPDQRLGDKLALELPAILRWALNGLSDWRENGLVTPTSVAAATNAYFDDQDVVKQWLEEACRIDHTNESLWETRKELFQSWSSFAKRNGVELKTQKWLLEKLRSRGLTDAKRTGIRGFKGIKVNALENNTADEDLWVGQGHEGT